jgi:hypothetical protein
MIIKQTMEIMNKLYITIFLIFSLIAAGHANNTILNSVKNIYVSTEGNDLNPGTREKPLCSLTGARNLIRQLRATEKLKEAINVVVADGKYIMSNTLYLNELDSGSEDAPVTFIAEEGARPVFIGGIQIKNWEKVSDKLWKTDIKDVQQSGWQFEQLYVNGKRAIRAKSPNSGFYFLKRVTETIIDNGESKQALMAAQRLQLFPEDASTLALTEGDDLDNAVLTLYYKWDIATKKISGFNKDSSVIYTVGAGMKSWNPLDELTRYTVENYYTALDTCGEWFLEPNGELFYIPNDGETPENIRVFAPALENLIVLKGNPLNNKKVENIHFENLSFEVSGYRMPLSGNEAAQFASPIEAAVMADFVGNIEFTNCSIGQTGTNAIWFRKGCSHCVVQHCYLYDLGAGGIKIGETVIPDREQDLTRNITIDNNIIRSGGYVFPCGVGVCILHASDNTVTHNEIADFRYSAISVGWYWQYAKKPSEGNNIAFNNIHHLGWGETCDMGGVYCLGESPGTRIANNVVHHVFTYNNGGFGLYTHKGSTGIILENNLVYACRNAGFDQHDGKENIVRNNIFALNINGQLQAVRVEQHLSFTFTNNIIWYNSGILLGGKWDQFNIKSDSNCYWDTRSRDIWFSNETFKEWQKTGKDVHSVIADPGFSDPLNHDFRLKETNIAKKIGFVPFDYSQAGVYGCDEWKKLAQFDKKLSNKFDNIVAKFK